MRARFFIIILASRLFSQGHCFIYLFNLFFRICLSISFLKEIKFSFFLSFKERGLSLLWILSSGLPQLIFFVW